MGRYDDDDSEYVVYGNMSSYFVSDTKYRNLFDEKYVPKIDIDLEKLSVKDIKILVDDYMNIRPNNIQILSKYGISQEDIEKNITWDDICDTPEFSEYKGYVSGDYKDCFSSRHQIFSKFVKKVQEISKQDTDKSLYLRLLLLTNENHIDKDIAKKIYKDPHRRLMFVKGYLQLGADKKLQDLLSSFEGCYISLEQILQDTKPEEARGILLRPEAPDCIKYYYGERKEYWGYDLTMLPYLEPIIKDSSVDNDLRLRYMGDMLEGIEYKHSRKNNYEYSAEEFKFYNDFDELLPKLSAEIAASGNDEQLADLGYIISTNLNENNPHMDHLSSNMVKFFEQHTPSIVNALLSHRYIEIDNYIPNEYLDIASPKNTQAIIELIKAKKVRYKYGDFLKKHNVAMYDALGFKYAKTDEEERAILNEGIYIKTTENKIDAYNFLGNDLCCYKKDEAYDNPQDIAKRDHQMSIALNLFKKLNQEHPLNPEDMEKLSNKTYMALLYTGVLKNGSAKYDGDIKNSIVQESLIKAGKIKVTARSQAYASHISEYCDVNETWQDSDTNLKTNLLECKLQDNDANGVTQLLNRGFNVFSKVERKNREDKIFPITPFEKYASGLLFWNKGRNIYKLEDLMREVAENIKPQKLFTIKKMFDSLTPKTHNNPAIQKIEQQVNQIVTERMVQQRFSQNTKGGR